MESSSCCDLWTWTKMVGTVFAIAVETTDFSREVQQQSRCHRLDREVWEGTRTGTFPVRMAREIFDQSSDLILWT